MAARTGACFDAAGQAELHLLRQLTQKEPRFGPDRDLSYVDLALLVEDEDFAAEDPDEYGIRRDQRFAELRQREHPRYLWDEAWLAEYLGRAVSDYQDLWGARGLVVKIATEKVNANELPPGVIVSMLADLQTAVKLRSEQGWYPHMVHDMRQTVRALHELQDAQFERLIRLDNAVFRAPPPPGRRARRRRVQ